MHDVGLARRHERRDRQLRVRVRAVSSRGPGPGDAKPLAQRGGAAEDDAGRDAVGLGDVPRVPRQRRPHAEGREHDVAGAVGAAVPVRRRRRQGEGAARRPTRSWRRCASCSSRRWRPGGCGWSSQILGDIGNVQRDYDGTPMVTDHDDRARGDRLLPRARATSAAARPRSPARSRPRRSSPARAAGRSSGTRSASSGSVNQHGEMEYPHRIAIERLRQLQRGGGRPRLRAGQHRAVPLGDLPRGIQPHGHRSRPGGKRCLGTVEEKIAKFADPERREGLKDAITTDRWRVRRGAVPAGEIKVNWISSDAPNAAELKERYEGLDDRRDRGA